jgi:hypothetical protein
MNNEGLLFMMAIEEKFFIRLNEIY